MARSLIADLDIIQTRKDGRRPAFKVEVYDIRSGGDTIGDIVRGLTLAADTGPRDFTDDVVSVSITEQAGDIVESGVAGTSVSLVVADPNNQFDPFNTIGSPSGLGRWLRRGNVIRIYEGDTRVPEADWPITFTGVLQGQAGTRENRNPDAGARRLTIKAVDRSSGFLRYKNTSDEFDIGNTYLDAATDIATIDMGLDLDELDFAGFGSYATLQPFSFVDEEPLVSIARLMMVDGFLPKFDGEGKLTQTQPLLIASPDRVYTDDGLFEEIDRPFSEISPTNRVTVIGLDGNLSKASQPRQELLRISLTTGYFNQDEDVTEFWSEDRTLLAENVTAKVEKSVNGGLSALGGDETFTFIPAPNGLEGTIGAVLSIESGFAPWLIVFLTVTYIALSWVPDEVVTVGFGANTGITINVGSAAAAIALAAALFIMSKIGRGVYVYEGEPFEYVLAEIREIAEISGILAADRIEVTIENHLIQTSAQAAALARDVLFEQQARGNPRSIRMLHDLRLEPHDVFRTTSNRLFVVDKVQRTLQRGLPTIATVDVFESTEGLNP